MLQTNFWCWLAIVAMAAPLFCQSPTVESLAQEAMRNKSLQDRDLTEYTHDYEYQSQYFDGRGKLRKQVRNSGETYQSSNNNVNVALIWNGSPIDPKTIEKKRLEAAKQLQADMDRRMAGAAKGVGRWPEYGTTMFGFRMDIFRVLRNCPMQGLRKELLDGRETFVFDFLPASKSVDGMPHATQMRGTFWIDAQDRVVRRWQAFVVSGPSAGKQFWQEDYFKAMNRIWVNERIWLNLNVELPGWKQKERVEWTARFSNHKRFGVDVTTSAPEVP
jgi:hypothetical protein